ncbi:hypothetical protein [Anaeromicrobium sediminis]|uniref:Zinc-ribbon domain-containing protein n=1 Tax=Anaeromicrobium sediminis TaxID=1478221 RepID=A0A267MJ37_9FIRM|nr:hypothetical protein [Anaeromicrobium sediminis]PAB58810.1 hypothetical protein CCE28_13010 [Anaeromicrobium sediminis]
MFYCRKCGDNLKEPYKFCSVCGCRQDIELKDNEKDSKAIDNSKDEPNKKNNREYHNDIDKEKLIIGKICDNLY